MQDVKFSNYIIFVPSQAAGLFFWLRLWELNPLPSAYETDEISSSLKSQYKKGRSLLQIPYENATVFIIIETFKNVKRY